MYKDLIDLVKCYDKINRYYAISILKVADSIKGYLLIYFKLLEV